MKRRDLILGAGGGLLALAAGLISGGKRADAKPAPVPAPPTPTGATSRDVAPTKEAEAILAQCAPISCRAAQTKHPVNQCLEFATCYPNPCWDEEAGNWFMVYERTAGFAEDVRAEAARLRYNALLRDKRYGHDYVFIIDDIDGYPNGAQYVPLSETAQTAHRSFAKELAKYDPVGTHVNSPDNQTA